MTLLIEYLQGCGAMIDFKLYNTSSENNKIDKTLNNEYVTTIVIKDDTNILTPTVQLNIAYDNIINKNYCYIPLFNRYYFITSLINVSNSIFELHLKCDVLMSHKDEILNLSCVINRSTSNYNSYFVDNELSCYNNPRIQTKVFPNKDIFNMGRSYLLTVSGGN